jgi:hypothetical protein
MTDRRRRLYRIIATVCAIPTAFFIYFGVQLIYTAVTFEGEGSLGHVGMYIAAGLYPFLAFVFGSLSMLAWRKSQSKPDDTLPPNNG